LTPEVLSVFAQSSLATLTSLDNVYGDNLIAIPEPDMYVLLLAGLGIAGWLLRRRGAAER
jgi:hypothetical protein